jgi:hypothetical protein
VALGGPQPRRVGSPAGQHLLDPLGDHLGGPVHHGEDAAAPGRGSVRRLAEADMTDAERPELQSLRVRAEVAALEHQQLPASQSPAIGDLQHRGVPERRRPALGPPAPHHLRPVVGRVEQRLALLFRERPPLWLGLLVDTVHGEVGRSADLHGVGAEALQAQRVPPIGGIAHVVQEGADREAIAANRRVGPTLPGPQARHPVLEVGR